MDLSKYCSIYYPQLMILLFISLVQHGPFVMNTREEISQAIEDYQMGKNGFEMAHKWKSLEGNK